MSKFGTKIKVELVTHGCFPTKAYETDAAYDLHVAKDTEMAPYNRYYVPLGFKISASCQCEDADPATQRYVGQRYAA